MRIALALATFLWSASTLSAAFVIGTSSNPTGGAVPVASTQWEAQSISTSLEGEDIRIESLTLELDHLQLNEFFTVGIVRSDASGFRPDTSEGFLVEFDVTPLVEGEEGSVMLTPLEDTNRILLGGKGLENTRNYWIVFGATANDPENGAGRYDWSYASSATQNESIEGWSVGSYVSSGGAGGTNWTSMSASGSPYLFSLEVNPVPEPAYAALFFGLFVGASVRWIKRW